MRLTICNVIKSTAVPVFECWFVVVVSGEEAHKRLLPQPHVPSIATHQPQRSSDILRPCPILPRSIVTHRRCHRSYVGLLRTLILCPALRSSNMRQSLQNNEAKFYCAFIIIIFYHLLNSEPFFFFEIFFYFFIRLSYTCGYFGLAMRLIIPMSSEQNTAQLNNNHALPPR